ncbi:MAG: hypothetical protein IT584_01985 [Chlamydiae bacterium]|nr:hypothetical protein [Chlamydiota bacterium]
MVPATLCFIVCHAAPADHFAVFAQRLSSEASPIEIYATGPAIKKFQDRNMQVKSFSLSGISSEEEDALARQIAKACSASRIVFTDVGHPFAVKMQKALALWAENALRVAYYDNPERGVPGGYSIIAAQVMQAANQVFFANANLIDGPIFESPDREVNFGQVERVGIGYCPLDQVEKIAERRKFEKASIRGQVFSRHQLVENQQKVFVYFGGNNTEYFEKAFPKFLSLLEEASLLVDLSNLVFVLQQHPGAKEKNLDAAKLSEWLAKTEKTPKIILSDFSSDDAQVLADGALYYQTSMGPQFALAGIPTVQIGHEVFADLLVRSGLTSPVTHVDQFLDVLDSLGFSEAKFDREAVLEALGVRKDWLQILQAACLAKKS